MLASSYSCLKFSQINNVLCIFSPQQFHKDAYLSRDPQWDHIPPNLRSDDFGTAPTTEGIPSQKYLLFCSSEEMRLSEAEGSEGGVCLNWITMVTSITFLSPYVRTRGNEFQNGDGCFNRHLFLTPAKQQRHHWLDKDSVTVWLLLPSWYITVQARHCSNANVASSCKQ